MIDHSMMWHAHTPFAFTRGRAPRSALATGVVLCVLCTALPGCNTVAVKDESTVVIEHTTLRSREAVYESALRVCKRQGKEQAVFQSQANQDPAARPATGPQLSTFACR